jgi:hypothetical protein
VRRERSGGTRGAASTSPRGGERGERMLLRRAPELPGLAAGEAREVWSEEETRVPRGEALRVGPGWWWWREGGSHCPRPSMLGTGLSWRREGGGARPTDRGRGSGCRPDLLHFTRACLPFIRPVGAVRTPQLIGSRNLTFKITFPFELIFFFFLSMLHCFPLGLGTVLNLIGASSSQGRKLVVTPKAVGSLGLPSLPTETSGAYLITLFGQWSILASRKSSTLWIQF